MHVTEVQMAASPMNICPVLGPVALAAIILLVNRISSGRGQTPLGISDARAVMEAREKWLQDESFLRTKWGRVCAILGCGGASAPELW